MSVGGGDSTATRMAKALADTADDGLRYVPPLPSVEMMVREAVAALRGMAAPGVRVAEAFNTLVEARDGHVADPDGDAEVVLDAVRAMDRARTDLFRVLRAWMGEQALEDVAPQLEVFDLGQYAPDGLVGVRDDEFRTMVPQYATDDPVLLMTLFSEEKRRAFEATGGDFGPDAADPHHYRGCPGESDPEDCTCMSSGGLVRPPRMAVAADGTRFVVHDPTLVEYERMDGVVGRSSDPTAGVIPIGKAEVRHGPLRELFLPGSAEPQPGIDRVWVEAEIRRTGESAPFSRGLGDGGRAFAWYRDGTAYQWGVVNQLALVSDPVGTSS